MAKYLDHHKMVDLPKQAVEQLLANIKSGRADKDGVRPINLIMGKGEMWCLTEAPNAAVVEKHHEAMGLKLGKGDIVEVSTLV